MKTLFILSRKLVYGLLNLIDKVFSLSRPDITILTYHGIGDDNWYYGNSKEQFMQQIDYLNKHYHFVSLDQVEQWLYSGKKIPTPAVVITFDDGYKDILAVVPYLKTLKVKPTVFVMADKKTASRNLAESGRSFLSPKDLKVLIKSGWSIGSHGLTHRRMSRVNGEQLKAEISRSKDMIEKESGKKVKFFAYPYGDYTPACIGILNEGGYRLALTMDDKLITRKSNKYALPRIGVVRAHSLSEFSSMLGPSAIWFRNIIKELKLLQFIPKF